MWRIQPPLIDALDLYQSCVAGMRDVALAVRLEDAIPLLQPEYIAYTQAAQIGHLHTIPLSAEIGNVTGQEMTNLYENRMVRVGAPGRPVYDQIMAAAPNRRCPLCGHRRVSTLDHHLPKSRYAALTVFPLNLVASCKDCNTTKKVLLPGTLETLHPYFDDVEGGRWLTAQLLEDVPVSVLFQANPPESWSATIRARVLHHFSTFHLGMLYALEAADELSVVNTQVRQVRRTGNVEAVRAHLLEEAQRLEAVRPNWWRTVMYEALAASDWYCAGNAL
jgi:hypothetical protein